MSSHTIFSPLHTSSFSPSLTSFFLFPPYSLLSQPPTHSILYWTALLRSGDTIWNMSLANTSDTRPLGINGTRNISKLTFEPLRKSLYWINTNNATIERYDLQTKQLSTVARYAADITGTSRGVEGDVEGRGEHNL